MPLSTNVTDFVVRAATEDKRLRTLINGNVADLAGLNTAAKNNLVAAINELQSSIAGASGIDDAATGTTTSWSSSKTDAEITARLSELVDTAPDALNTLRELAAALGDDPNFAATLSGQIGAKANDADVVHLGGAETITGAKTFSTAPIVPDDAFGTAKVAGLDETLAGKSNTGHTHAAGDLTSGVLAADRLPGATEGAAGIVELATITESTAGTDTVRAVTPAGLAAVRAGLAPAVHTHVTGDITGLDAQLAGFAAAGHTHVIADITGLQAALDAKANAADVGNTATDFVAVFEAGLA
jgi:hypothetical protein